MHYNQLFKWHTANKEKNLNGRYITLDHLLPVFDKWNLHYEIKVVGKSVLGKPIHSVQAGSGPNKILMWSQMHGNESTTTKSVFDLFKWLFADDYKAEAEKLLQSCTLLIIPMLNPDGAEKYTRIKYVFIFAK